MISKHGTGAAVMDPRRDIDSLTDFEKNTPSFLEQLKATGEPLVLAVNGKAEFVLQDAASYQTLLDLVEDAKVVEGIRRGLEDMKAGEISLEISKLRPGLKIESWPVKKHRKPAGYASSPAGFPVSCSSSRTPVRAVSPVPRGVWVLESKSMILKHGPGAAVMDVSRDIHSLTDFEKNTPAFLEQLKATGEPLVLTSTGRPSSWFRTPRRTKSSSTWRKTRRSSKASALAWRT